MIRVKPRLLCLITVLSKTFGFSLTDWWFPYCRYASKFSLDASALQSAAGAPFVRIRVTSVNTSSVRIGFSFASNFVGLICWLTCGPPINLTTVAISPL